jgi:4-diphosphocytidyl-2-C-methyl-D-erythritol kinase
MIVKALTRDSCEIHAPAKINLYLQVLNKRLDGYHDINSLFQAVTLFDILRFKRISQAVCRIDMVSKNTVEIRENLVSKVFDLMKESFEFEGGIEVIIEKQIPVAAGLGGGSADAAATIRAINLIFDLGLYKSQEAQLGLKVGSDVPFFFCKGQAVVTGRGEEIRETGHPVGYKILLVKSPLSLSTKEGYAALKMGLTCQSAPYNLKDIRNLEDFLKSLRSFGNDFEKVQFNRNPKLGEIKEELENCGAVFARMSGSGPTIFGVFRTAKDTERACAINFAGCQLYTVEPFCLP